MVSDTRTPSTRDGRISDEFASTWGLEVRNMNAMITHNEEKQQFEHPGGAVLTYKLEGGMATFDRTFVPPELRGGGVAGKLARAALDHARDMGWRVVPACSYIEVFMKRNREYEDIRA